MKKISIVVHQNYLEDVIQNLHETGLVEIIDILKDESEDQQDIEKASMHPESGVCSTYVLRLTRLIDILKKTQIKPGGIKALLNPQIPEIRIIDEKSCGELYSLSEGILGEIENKILGFEKNLNELKEKKEKINFDSQQVSYLKDFELAKE